MPAFFFFVLLGTPLEVAWLLSPTCRERTGAGRCMD